MRRGNRTWRVVVGCAFALGAGLASPAAASPRPTLPPPLSPLANEGYAALTPARLLDTRPGTSTVDGLDIGAGPIGPNAVLDLKVLGRGGVPLVGVASVALHVTAVLQTQNTFVTVYPTGTSMPNTSNLNPMPGTVASNLAIVPVGAGGKVSLFNSAGSLYLIVDVVGWFPSGGKMTAVTPARVADTRSGAKIGAGASLTVPIAGHAGVPVGGVSAVVLNVTTLGATAQTFLTVYPSGTSVPGTSSLNTQPGNTAANLVVTPMGADGAVAIRNDSGSVHMIVDVVGWFATGPGYNPVTPTRVLDTRGAAPLGANSSKVVKLTGVAGVPSQGVGSVVFNLTAVNQTTISYLTEYPYGSARPVASSLNPHPGVVAPNLVIGKVGVDGSISIYNEMGTVDIIVDVVGWLPSNVTAVGDLLTANEDGPATAIAVLANDVDADGAGLRVQSVTQPTYGTATITGEGTGVRYVPIANYCNTGGAADTFTYTLYGGASATVSATVNCIDDLPVAVNDAVTVTEDSAAAAVAVLANDTDVDAGPKLILSSTQPTNGAVVITGGGTGLTYAPNPNYCNTNLGPNDTFSYTLNGGSVATVTVTVDCVDDAPIANPDFATMVQDGPPLVINVLLNDADIDGGPIGVGAVTGALHGTTAISPDFTSVTYTPNAGYCNTGGPADTFSYQLLFGFTATVNVSVTCLDNPPVAVADTATVAEDAVPTAIAVLGNDTDTDAGPKLILSSTQPSNGTVVITGGGTGLTYQPNANYCNAPPGTALETFMYTLTPGGSTATVTVTVTCVDDNPVAVNDAVTVSEDAAPTAVSVLTNEADPDGGPRSIASVTQPSNGAVVITGGGTGLTYQPNANYCNIPPGTTLDTFTYSLAPGGSTATVTVTVTCVDDNPVAVNDAATVTEDAAATAVAVLANDTDADGGPRSIASVTQPSSGAVVITGGGTGLTYQPSANYCNAPPGTTLDTFSYTLAPGGSTAAVTMTVTCVDDPPVAVADSATILEDAAATAIGVLANDTDPDGGTKLITGTTSATGGTVTVTGGGAGLTYTPNANYCNSPPGTTLDTFTYTITGGSTATVTVTVTCVNDAPTVANKSYTSVPNMRLTVPIGTGLLNGAVDPDGPTTLTVSNVSATSPAGGTVTPNLANGSFTFDPPPGASGAVTFTYKVCDDGIPAPSACSATVTATVTLTGTVIWFVDSSAAITGNGTLGSPFKTLAEASTAIGVNTGQGIFLYSGSYTGNLTMRANGRLYGQSTTGTTFDAAFGLVAVPSGVAARPTFNAVNANLAGTVTLANSAQVRGVKLLTGVAGSSATGVDVDQVTITSNTTPALDLVSVTGTVVIDSLTHTGGATGVNVSTSSAAVNIKAGSISNTSTAAVSLSGSSGNFTDAGSISVSAGRAVGISSMSGGTLSFSGAISATGGTGVSMTSSASNALFSGVLTLSTQTNAAFTATGGGTVEVTANGNTIVTTTGTALNVANTTITANGLKFQSISAGTGASGPANGIVLNSTGALGGLTVVGTGSANSGGTIQRTTGAGISLTATRNVSLTRMLIDNTAGSGIGGTGVVNFSLTNSTISNSGTGLGADTSNIAFNQVAVGNESNVSGTVTITGNSLLTAYWHGVSIVNFSGTLSSVDISGNVITSATALASSLGNAVELQALGSASTVANVTAATITNNTISNFPSGGGIVAQGGNANIAGPPGVFGSPGTANKITITGNLIHGESAANRMNTSPIQATVDGRGVGNFNISNNGTLAVPLGNSSGGVILVGGNGNTTSEFTVLNNIIVGNNIFGSQGIGGGTGVTFGNTDTPTMTISVSGNNISATDGNGILMVARGAAGQLNAKIQNNTVAAPLGGVRPGIRVDSGNPQSSADKVCLNISGNTSAGSGGSQGIGLRRNTSPSGVFAVNGMSATATPDVENYVNSLNPAGGSTLLISATSGFSNCSLP